MEAETPEDFERRSSRANAEGFARALGYPTYFVRDRFGFLEDSNEWRRMFAEALGTFFLVLVAAGAGMVNARFGGHAIGTAAQVAAPGLMVGAIILFMGSVSGAHLNPAVTLAFAMRRDFPWKRVPGYLLSQVFGGVMAVLVLVALVHKQGTAGLTLPGAGVSATTAMLWEMLLTAGLVSTILGTCSGARKRGPAQRDRGRRLHRARRDVGRADERGFDELGPDTRPRVRAAPLDRVVGIPRGPARGLVARGRHLVDPARAGRRLLRQARRAGRARMALAAGPPQLRGTDHTRTSEAYRARSRGSRRRRRRVRALRPIRFGAWASDHRSGGSVPFAA